MTRQIRVGGVPIGGGAPVTIQSMTNTRTPRVLAAMKCPNSWMAMSAPKSRMVIRMNRMVIASLLTQCVSGRCPRTASRAA